MTPSPKSLSDEHPTAPASASGPSRLPTKRDQLNSTSSPRTLESNRRWLRGLFPALSFSAPPVESEHQTEENGMPGHGQGERDEEEPPKSTGYNNPVSNYSDGDSTDQQSVADSGRITPPSRVESPSDGEHADADVTVPLAAKLWNLFTPPRPGYIEDSGTDEEDEQEGCVRPANNSGLLRLPDEILLQILAYLPSDHHSHLLTISLVSRRFHSLSQAPILWSNLIERRGYELRPEAMERCQAVLSPPRGRWTSAGWEWDRTTSSVASGRSSASSSGWRNRLLMSSGVLVSPFASPSKAPHVTSVGADPPSDRMTASAADRSTIPIHFPTLYRSLRHYRRTIRHPSSNHPYDTQILTDHTDVVYSVRFVGDWLISGGRDRTIRFWHLGDLPQNDASPCKCGEAVLVKTVESDHEGSVLNLVTDISVDDGRGILVSGSSDGTAAVWTIGGLSRVEKWGKASEPELKVERIATLTGHADGILAVSLSKAHIITGSRDTTLRVYARSNFALVRALRPHTTAINAVATHPDRQTEQVASGSSDGSWSISNLITGQEVLRVSNHTADEESRTGKGIACLVWKGGYILTGSSGGLARLHDASTGVLLGVFTGHSDTIRSVDLYLFSGASPVEPAEADTNGIVVSGSYDHSVRMWDLATGKVLRRFKEGIGGSSTMPSLEDEGHSNLVLDVQMDQGRLVSASYDRTIRVVTFGMGLPYRGLMMS